jgi:hypothetical protein
MSGKVVSAVMVGQLGVAGDIAALLVEAHINHEALVAHWHPARLGNEERAGLGDDVTAHCGGL